jgi:molybdopterin-containing oxidoreductase family molybdopterin binding subunit
MGKAADARARGMKMVVVDPMCNFASAKSTEWVPIRVGTDGPMALAMCNVIANELNTIDAPYLKAKTNGPYLIGPDKAYVRDKATDKPLVWDTQAKAARPYCDVASENMALEGTFEVDGVTCRTAYAVLREHLKSFTPEWAEKLTTVPATDIRRIATEFATEARIGSTIVIDGVAVPFRPAAAIAFRGSQGHVNSVYNFLAIDLLNELVGSSDMAGGCLGFNPACDGYPGTGRLRYAPYPDRDGLMVVGSWMAYHDPYPPAEPRLPQNLGLQDLFTMGMTSPFISSTDQHEMWDRFEVPYRPEMLINFGANLLMSIGNKDTVAESLKDYKFIVSFDLVETETTTFADIVLPDCDYLESVDSRSNFPFIFSLPGGMGDWCWPIRQPVVEPDGQQRGFVDVLIELADRAGFLADFNAGFNAAMDLRPPFRLSPDKRYSYDEVCDADLRDKFGAEHGLEWFKAHGVMKWPKKPNEVYWRHFVDVRVPIYWEWMPALREKIAAIAEPRGLPIPAEHYEPLPNWLPCPSHECDRNGFDFYAFYYRDIIHTNSFTMENPWLDEAAQLDPFSYAVAINADTARRKGIPDGADVWIENDHGRRIKGRIRVTQGVHPEGLGVAACLGHWGNGMPVAKGKGAFYNDLLELDWEHSSPVNLNLDLCAKVRVTLAEATP